MPQKVDPFIPIKHQPPRRRPVQPPARVINDIVAAPTPQPKQKLDQLRPWYNVQKPQSVRSMPSAQTPSKPPDPQPLFVSKPTTPAAPPAQITPKRRRPAAEKPHKSRFSKLMSVLSAGKYVLLGAAMLAAGMMLQIAAIGEVLIGVYAVLALIRRIESRTSFLLALVSFGYIIIMLFTHPDQSLMKNFATYAFLFLLIGAVIMLREARYED